MTTKTEDTARAALESAIGTDRIRQAGPADRIGEATPNWVATVDGTEQTAAAMRAAAEHGLSVVASGARTKLTWGGTPQSADLLLDLSTASGVVEHAAGDLVVHAKAGTPIAEVQRVVAQAGQQLSIDPVLPSATVGGAIATATSGPGRHLFGGVRDLLIGITVVRADGTVTISGGKVVKNVAGYDLGKIYTGSHGTLGVITEAIFRLHPLAEEHRWISTTADTAEEAAAAADAVRQSQAMPTAIELDRPRPGGPITVCAQLEGRTGTTHERALALAGAVAPSCEVLDTAPAWWGSYPFDSTDGIGLRLGTKPAALPGLLATAQRAAERHDLPLALRGAAGLGVLHAGLPADTPAEHVAELVSELREHDGYAVLLTAPRPVRDAIDLWGPAPAGVLDLMRRTKAQFDPENRLAPGRFMGGI